MRNLDETKNIYFSNKFYRKYLSTINNVYFTRREIDIIACLLQGWTQKTIAYFLLIAPRTVETHMRNIMLKLESNSREGIISYVEDAGKTSLLREHYQLLLIQAEFEKQLSAIAALNTGELNTCSLVYTSPSNEDTALVDVFKEHLQKAGVKIFNQNSNLSKFSPNNNNIIIHIVCTQPLPSLVNQYAEVIKNKNCKLVVFIILIQETLIDSFPSNKNIHYINLNKNYYLSFFELLKIILPKISFDEHISLFTKKASSLLSNPAQNSLHRDLNTERTTRNRESELFKRSHFYPVRIKLIAVFAIIMAASALFLNNLSFKQALGGGEKQINPPSSTLTKPNSVRSDLFVPQEHFLLNRPKLMKQIDNNFTGKENIETVALVGMIGIGGAGKTTLARNYAKTQSSNLIWEINAENKVSIMNSFKDLMYALAQTKQQREELNFILAIQNTEIREKQLISFVKNYLRENNNWLLIYDNVDDFYEIKNYFPFDAKIWGTGRVIITTRNTNLQSNGFIRPEKIVLVDELIKHEALTLFCKIFYGKEPQQLTQAQVERTTQLLKSIPPFPLDVSIAAHYIKSERLTYEQYLEKVMRFDREFENSHENLLKEISEYTKTRYGIISWVLSKLIERKPYTKEALFFIFLLNSQNIPKNLLKQFNVKFSDNIIYDLRKRGLITRETASEDNEEEPSFSIHRSTQAIGFTFMKNFLNERKCQSILEDIMLTIKNFPNYYRDKNFVKASILVPHLESLIKNITQLKLRKELKEKYELQLSLLLAKILYEASSYYVSAKKIYIDTLKHPRVKNYLSNKEFAEAYNSLAYVCVDLGDLDEAIQSAQQGLKYCKISGNMEYLEVDNLICIAHAYAKQNDIKNAEFYFKAALQRIPNLEPNVRNEVKSKTYGLLSLCYSTHFINKNLKAEEFAIESLKILNACHTYYSQTTKPKEKLPCEIARNKYILGQAYRLEGKYKEAIEQGYDDSQFIIDNSLSKCDHSLVKIVILLGKGECLLRLGQLEKAVQNLTKSIQESKKLVGELVTLEAKAIRAEARIRLKEYDKAFEDCLAVFNLQKRKYENYVNLIYITCYYHAAFIKYKQHDLVRTIKYLSTFLDKIEPFCKEFLDSEAYKKLELDHKFSSINPKKIYNQSEISVYFKNSLEIFSSIYGSSHPFVRDYILKNYQDIQQAKYQKSIVSE